MPDKGARQKPLDILGEQALVKLTNTDTDGAAAVFHLTVPPMSGPPMHCHSREDEWCYVLEGKITAEISGRQIVLDAGGSAFAPRGIPHTYQNFGHATAQTLVIVTPEQSKKE